MPYTPLVFADYYLPFVLGRCFPFSAAFGFRVAGFFGLMVLFSFNRIISREWGVGLL